MVSSGCQSLDGTLVEEGENFVPGPDMCTMCKCANGQPILCRSVLCMSPTECEFFKKGDTCCDYICLDDKGGNNSSDLGVRMMSSAIIGVLALGLFVFLIHRLRQRKLRAAQHQYFSEHLETLGSLPGDSCHSNPCCHTAAYFQSNDQVNTFLSGTTPPYSPWKASLYFQNKEPPPTYNEAVRTNTGDPDSEHLQIPYYSCGSQSLSNINESDLGTRVSGPLSSNEDSGWLSSLSLRHPNSEEAAQTPITSDPLVSIPNRHSQEHESSLREACDARQKAIQTREDEHEGSQS